MPDTKIIVIYDNPVDADAFEAAYEADSESSSPPCPLSEEYDRCRYDRYPAPHIPYCVAHQRSSSRLLSGDGVSETLTTVLGCDDIGLRLATLMSRGRLPGSARHVPQLLGRAPRGFPRLLDLVVVAALLKCENSGMHQLSHNLDAAATVIAALHHDNTSLRQELGQQGEVVALKAAMGSAAVTYVAFVAIGVAVIAIGLSFWRVPVTESTPN